VTEPPPLVLTGASGFVGRRLLHALALHTAAPLRHVTILARTPAALAASVSLPDSWRVVEWDLTGTAAIPPGILRPESVVLHLASATGRASAATMRGTIVEGTRRLVDACASAGVRHLVVVSSIAAVFPDRRWYPYAEAKREAEGIVLGGGVPATIVRPTMVFGPGSPVQAGLQRLATGRLPLILGNGSVETQPVDVEDLVAVLVGLADRPPAGQEVLEIGGGDRCTLRELLAQMRAARRLPPRRAVAIPLALPRRILAALEPILGTWLPVSAGQLASFVNPSIATPHPMARRLLPEPRSLAAMLASAAEPAEAPDPGSAATAHEFAVLARYLGCPDPGPDASDAYRRARAHAIGVPEDALDRRLRRVAAWSPAGCALADSYARIVRPYGTLRRTLVLALAVLESTAKNHAAFDSAKAAPAALTWLAIGGRGLAWVAWTLGAVLALGPTHLVDRLRGRLAGGPVG